MFSTQLRRTQSAEPRLRQLVTPHLDRLAMGEPDFEGRISRRDIDRHKSASGMLGAHDVATLKQRMGLVDARHIIPAKWFTHGFNRVWSRIIDEPDHLPILQAALASVGSHTDGLSDARDALLELNRKAINQEVNFFVGPREINQLNGALIGRTRKLLVAHDKIVSIYRDWHEKVSRFQCLGFGPRSRSSFHAYLVEVESLARTIEKTLFNPGASPESAMPWGKAKIGQTPHREIAHLAPILEAIIDAIYTLGKAAIEPTEGVRRILDLTVSAVDSVCVDPSQVGHAGEGAQESEPSRLFRAMQNDCLLPLGARLISSTTRFCNALDADAHIAAHTAARDYIETLDRFTAVAPTLDRFWALPTDTHGMGRILGGLSEPTPRVPIAAIEAHRAKLHEEHRARLTTRLPLADEAHLKLHPDNAVGLCHRDTAPDWIREIPRYLNRAAHGESLFDPWL